MKKNKGFLSKKATRPKLTSSHRKFDWKKKQNGLKDIPTQDLGVTSKGVSAKGIKPSLSNFVDEHRKKFGKDKL